jgi:magnesium chelatase accessory protein
MIAVQEIAGAARAVTDRMVQADGLLWHVVECGQGPVILLIHGTAASTHSWRDVMPLLAETCHVVAIDLPGHGGTRQRTSSDLKLERMGRGIAAVMAALQLSPDIVVGHSAGAAILAWVCAQKHFKPKTFISFNGAFFPFGGIAGSLFSPIARLIAFSPFVSRLLTGVASRAKVEKLLRDTGSKISPAGVDLYVGLFRDSGHVSAALGMMAAWDLRGMEDNLARLDTECVFVAGRNDRAVPPDTARRAAALCRNAKVQLVSGLGHLLHEENPVLAADIVGGRRS